LRGRPGEVYRATIRLDEDGTGVAVDGQACDVGIDLVAVGPVLQCNIEVPISGRCTDRLLLVRHAIPRLRRRAFVCMTCRVLVLGFGAGGSVVGAGLDFGEEFLDNARHDDDTVETRVGNCRGRRRIISRLIAAGGGRGVEKFGPSCRNDRGVR